MAAFYPETAVQRQTFRQNQLKSKTFTKPTRSPSLYLLKPSDQLPFPPGFLQDERRDDVLPFYGVRLPPPWS